MDPAGYKNVEKKNIYIQALRKLKEENEQALLMKMQTVDISINKALISSFNFLNAWISCFAFLSSFFFFQWCGQDFTTV